MKLKRAILGLAFGATISTAAYAQNTPIQTQVAPPLFAIDPAQSFVQFFVNARLTNVKGIFKQFYIGTIAQSGDDISTLRGTLLIDTASVFTREKKRDDHLKANDFFWSEKFPNAIATVKDVKPAGTPDLYNVTLSLRIRDKEKDFIVPATITRSATGLIANGKFIVDRTYYDLNGEYLANKIMDDEAEITFRLALNKAK
ncbi:MAG: YceI family protein [Leptospirales bacterium]|nr:YceI family protein [Leptospirales bacterium]